MLNSAAMTKFGPVINNLSCIFPLPSKTKPPKTNGTMQRRRCVNGREKLPSWQISNLRIGKLDLQGTVYLKILLQERYTSEMKSHTDRGKMGGVRGGSVKRPRPVRFSTAVC